MTTQGISRKCMVSHPNDAVKVTAMLHSLVNYN